MTQNIYDLVDTWNDAGVTFSAIKMNVTNTASNAASLLMDLQVGGVSKFVLNKDGLIGTPGGITMGSTNVYAVGTFVNTSGLGGIYASGSVTWRGANNGGAAIDLYIYRDAADTLAQRRATNAQTFRLYQSYTDSVNFTRAELKAAGDIVTLEGASAGTGAANIDVQLTPKGTGRVRFGTHAAVAAETVTGYIEIKDAGGTVRKVAVVS